MKYYILILFLSGIICSLSAQSTDTTELQLADSTLLSVEPRGCVGTFESQTISTSTVVTGCSTLTVQNVTVTNTGNLMLSAPQEVAMNGAFEVQLGGVLSVNDALVRYTFSYSYDAAGNRITRRFSTTSPANVTND